MTKRKMTVEEMVDGFIAQAIEKGSMVSMAEYSEFIEKTGVDEAALADIIAEKGIAVLGGDEDISPEDIDEFMRDDPPPQDEFDDPDETVDYVRDYIREIARIPLLTEEQEKQLTTRLYSLRMAYEKASERAVAHPEDELSQADMKKKEAEMIKARNKLVEHNLRLSVSVGKKYLKMGLDPLDVFSAGNKGLMTAAMKFDPGYKTKYSTYSVWWVKQAIIRDLRDHGRTIRLPVHMVEQVNWLKKTQKKLLHLNEKEATVARLTEELMKKEGRDNTEKEYKAAEKKVKELLYYSNDVISLNLPAESDGENSGTEMGDFIADNSEKPVWDIVDRRLLKDNIADALDELTGREKMVLTRRYGLADGKSRTLEEVGAELSVTRERIRQIEAKALRKLRAKAKNRTSSVYKLSEFYGCGMV